MYKSGQGLTNCTSTGRWMVVGSPSAGIAPFTHVPFGFPHGLLQHDMVEQCARAGRRDSHGYYSVQNLAGFPE